MAIYDAGTASLAADGTVIGVGTTWRQPLTLIRVGATMIFNTTPASIVTIAEIISDTEIRVFNDKGFTAPTGTQYSILAHDGITVQGLAQDVAETLRYYQSRETEVADAVDAFNNFDADSFQQSVTNVNNQSQQVALDAAQVSSDKNQVSSDKDLAEASASMAQQSAQQAASSASSISGALIGSFQSGVTLESKTQQILDLSSDKPKSYVWSGGLPKTVPANSTPESTGGIGVGAWLPVSGSSVSSDLAMSNGYKYIGEVSSFSDLRLLVPSSAGERVKLRGWLSGSSLGGGDFISVSQDLVDDGGVTAKVNSSYSWVRVVDGFVTFDMFGALGDGVSDDTLKVNNCLAYASSVGVKVIASRKSTYLCSSLVNLRSAYLDGLNKLITIKRSASADKSLDFVFIGDGGVIKGVTIDGTRLASEAPTESVLVRASNNSVIESCDISGSPGYLIVGNTTSRLKIVKNELHNSGHYAVALYGDATSLSSEFMILENNVYDVGWGSFTVQGYNSGLIRDNSCTGTYIGGPGDRLYVSTNTNGAITRVSGPSFSGLKAGMWVVLPGGTEHRITSVSSESNISVSPPPDTTSSSVRAIIGTGDHIGIQSCSFVKVINNRIRGSVTYGTGGGTMAGYNVSCTYCEWESNSIQSTGKNGINLTQTGASIVNCSIKNNTLIFTGSGGVGSSSSYLLPEFDTAGIGLYQSNAFSFNDTLISGNRVIAYNGDLGAGVSWLSMVGMSEGTVYCSDNSASGYANSYVLGDIISISISGYGTGSAFTSYASTGDKVSVSIQAGSGASSSPSFNVRKVIRSQTEPVILAQIATTTGNLAFCWGVASSTPSSWNVVHAGTPSGITTYHVRS